MFFLVCLSGSQASINRIFIDSSTVCYMKKVTPPFSSKSLPGRRWFQSSASIFLSLVCDLLSCRWWEPILLLLRKIKPHCTQFHLLWNDILNTFLRRGWDFWHMRFDYYCLSFCSHTEELIFSDGGKRLATEAGTIEPRGDRNSFNSSLFSLWKMPTF